MIGNQRGQSLIEVIIAMALSLIAIYAMVSFLVNLNNINGRLKLQRLTTATVQSFAENIRYDTSLFQVTFDNSGKAESDLLTMQSLPLAITAESSIIDRALCAKQSCRAYMGYLIIPHEFIRNLYEVKFLVVNASDESAKWETSYYITVR
ncbi:hypothetical protein D3C87_109550 [compost metagenome]